MKILYYMSILCLLGVLPLHAEETPSTLKELITQVQNAPDDQKRVLMNQLKTQLKQMSKENRQKTMKALKKSFSSNRTGSLKHQNNAAQPAHILNHQPKFRHLQRGQGGGNIHQGMGHR